MRVVLDVNVMVSALLRLDSTPAYVLQLALGESHELIVSQDMLDKLVEVLSRPYFLTTVTDQERQDFVDSIQAGAKVKTPDPSVTGVADDEEDDLVLGTAVAGRAHIIVTGDKGLLAIGSFMGIPIVTARTFVDLVDA